MRYTVVNMSIEKKTTVLKTKGERTRHAILTTAADLATQEGLEALSIGRLAEATGMSKSGLFAHFGSKEELQIATVEHAASLVVDQVIAPARSAPRGLPRVWALCDHKLRYLRSSRFFRAAASSPPLLSSSAIARALFATGSRRCSARGSPTSSTPSRRHSRTGSWTTSLSAHEITFELDSFAVAANFQYHLFGDPAVFEHARRATRERLEQLRVAQAA